MSFESVADLHQFLYPHHKRLDVHRRLHQLIDSRTSLFVTHAHKMGITSQLVSRVVWELIKDPTKRIVYIHQNYMATVMLAGLVHLDCWRASDVVPSLKGIRKDGSNRLNHETSPYHDPSLLVTTIDNELKGYRADMIIVDGYFRTADELDTNRHRISTLRNRIIHGGKLIVTNSIALEGAPIDVRIPVYRSMNPIQNIDSCELVAPELFDRARIRMLTDTMTPNEFVSQYLCITSKEADVLRRKIVAL